jgi:hypothetical protein
MFVKGRKWPKYKETQTLKDLEKERKTERQKNR